MNGFNWADDKSATFDYAAFLKQDTSNLVNDQQMAREAVVGGGGTLSALQSSNHSLSLNSDFVEFSAVNYDLQERSVIDQTNDAAYSAAGRVSEQWSQVSTVQVQAENIRATNSTVDAEALNQFYLSYAQQSSTVSLTVQNQSKVSESSSAQAGVITTLSIDELIEQEQAQNTTQQSDSKKLDGLRKNFDTTLSNFFGDNDVKIKKYGKLFDDLQSISPEIYAKAMVLLTMLGEENSESFLKGLQFFSDSMKQLNAGGAEVSTQSVAENEVTGGTSLQQTFAGYELRFSAVEVEGKIKFNFTVGEDEEANSQQVQSLSISQQLRVIIEGEGVFKDPLVLDMNGDGVNLRSAEDGVEFDLDGDGVAEKTGFVQGDDALLYLDANGNGLADNGLELFGDQDGDAHGFAKLAKYDENNDGRIDSQDKIYATLKIWQDYNRDGINQEDESASLLKASIESIELGYENLYKKDESGNILAQTGSFTRSDGSRSLAVDVLLRQYA